MPPSPTGYVHIGNVRTLLFNYLFAKKHNGKIIFRSEDTDAVRSRREYEDANREDLAWLGLSWDEFFRQTERRDIHRMYLEQLIEEGKAYLSKEESEKVAGETVTVVRLKNPGKTVTFVDEVRGEITFDTTELGDVIIARAIDDPLYHFAVVADDFDMGVTHIIRGEEHISNTPRQILIQEALGAPRPVYVHLPIILAPDRTKLSKRHGATSLREYRRAGYLKEALVNYLALIGWSPGTDEEFFTLQELVVRFDLGGIQKSAGVFNSDKLHWFNRAYIKKLPDVDFREEARKRVPQKIIDLLNKEDVIYSGRFERLLPTVRDRTNILSDIATDAEKGEYDFAFFAPQPSPELLMWKKDTSSRDTLKRLKKLVELFEALPSYPTAEEAKAACWEYAEKEGRGEVLWPLRVVLSGREKSPDPFTIIYILGKEETLKRLKNACDIIANA